MVVAPNGGGNEGVHHGVMVVGRSGDGELNTQNAAGSLEVGEDGKSNILKSSSCSFCTTEVIENSSKMLDRYSKEWLQIHKTFSWISLEHMLQEIGCQFLQSSLAAMEESWLKQWSRPTTPLQIAYEFSKFHDTELLRHVHDSVYIRKEDTMWGEYYAAVKRAWITDFILQQWWSKVHDYSSSPQWSSCRVLWNTVPVSPCFTSRQDCWTSCSCIGGNLHEFQKPSKIPSISARLPVMVSTSIFDISPCVTSLACQ